MKYIYFVFFVARERRTGNCNSAEGSASTSRVEQLPADVKWRPPGNGHAAATIMFIAIGCGKWGWWPPILSY